MVRLYVATSFRTAYCEHWPLRWALLRSSLLHSTSWRGTYGPSAEASPSSWSRKAAMSLSSHCHLRFLSPVRGSLSWAAILALPPSLKRCSRAGLPSSRSLCTRWATLIWWLLMLCPPQVFLCHSHLSSFPCQPSLLECRLYHLWSPSWGGL